jgi:hypothetical protein
MAPTVITTDCLNFDNHFIKMAGFAGIQPFFASEVVF